MINQGIDYLYFLFGMVGKCYACNYKNRPVYSCTNKDCIKRYCLDCWEDNTGQFVCKKCQVYEFN